jgi:pimeloyl-ACP methyl ester carboxylesterase
MKLRGLIYKLINVLLIALLAACSPPKEASDTQVNIMQLCPGFVETGKPPLVFGAQCGELLVPENPEDPAGAMIKLSILRLPAISPVPNADPLLLIQGGPGGSSIEMASQIHQFFNDVRKNRDLIFVDQRGTGTSNPLQCEPMAENFASLPESEQQQLYVQAMKNCAEKYRLQAPFFTTPQAVQDLDTVRKALGYAQINLWGGSYGTRVAMEYARRYPEHARTLVLDGVAPVAIALPKYFARDAFAALSAVNAECQAQIECANSFGNIVDKANAVLQRLADLQAAGEPLHVAYEHPRHQQSETLVLTPKSFSSLLFMSLYSRDLTVLLPRAISSAERGDYRLLAALNSLSAEQANNMNIAEAMRYSVVCNEDWQLISAADVAQSEAFLGMNFVQDMAAVCEFWPKASLPSDYWKPITSNVPALLLSGNHDPVTPIVWAKNLAEHFPNATLLEAPGGNHSISMEGCVPQIIAQFIERASMDNIQTECVAQIKPLPLLLGANRKQGSSSSAASAGSSQHD